MTEVEHADCWVVNSKIIQKPFKEYDISHYNKLYIEGYSFPLSSPNKEVSKLKPFVESEIMYRNLIKHDIDFNKIEIEESMKVFSYTNYYRLSVYERYLGANKRNFTEMLNLYEFDQSLSNLISSMIPTIENYLKCTLAYSVVKKYQEDNNQLYEPAICYLDENIYKEDKDIKAMLSVFADILESKREKDEIVKHHIDNYGGNIPFWVLAEFLTMGNIHVISTNLKRTYRKNWSDTIFNKKTSEKMLPEWISTIRTLRNSCAHNARFYGSRPTYNPQIIDDELSLVLSNFTYNGNSETIEKEKYINKFKHTVFAGIITMKLFYKPLPEVEQKKWNNFVESLEQLINKYNIDLYKLGFLENWKEILIIDI